MQLPYRLAVVYAAFCGFYLVGSRYMAQYYLIRRGSDIGNVIIYGAGESGARVVQAIKSDMERIIRLIDGLDRPTPQIQIEAHLVEANDEVARELGVQWGGLHHSGDYYITPGSRTGSRNLRILINPIPPRPV